MLSQNIIKNRQNGYTLVEMLVAGVLLIAVLVPALLYLGKIIYNTKAGDTIVAMELARARMEKTFAGSSFKKIEEIRELNHKFFVIRQDIQEKNDFMIISVSVYREKDLSPLMTFRKSRMRR